VHSTTLSVAPGEDPRPSSRDRREKEVLESRESDESSVTAEMKPGVFGLKSQQQSATLFTASYRETLTRLAGGDAEMMKSMKWWLRWDATRHSNSDLANSITQFCWREALLEATRQVAVLNLRIRSLIFPSSSTGPPGCAKFSPGKRRHALDPALTPAPGATGLYPERPHSCLGLVE
jgi:hypothetical protein